VAFEASYLNQLYRADATLPIMKPSRFRFVEEHVASTQALKLDGAKWTVGPRFMTALRFNDFVAPGGRRRNSLRLVALLLMLAVIASPWRSSPEAKSEPPTDVVEVEIGDQHLAIPRPYIANIARKSDGTTILVRLSVLWPGFEPLTPENQSSHAPELPGRQLIRVVIGRPIDGYKQLQWALAAGWLDPPPAAAPFNLKIYRKEHAGSRRTARRFVPNDDEYVTPLGSPVVFHCDDLFDWDAQRTMVLEPICIVEYSIQEEIGIRYHFYKKNLQDCGQLIKVFVVSLGPSSRNGRTRKCLSGYSIQLSASSTNLCVTSLWFDCRTVTSHLTMNIYQTYCFSQTRTPQMANFT
jgi:hypothetical protein